jgi:phage shock protein A
LQTSVIKLEEEKQALHEICNNLQSAAQQSISQIKELKFQLESLETEYKSLATERKALIAAKENEETARQFWKQKHDAILNSLEENQTSHAMQQ